MKTISTQTRNDILEWENVVGDARYGRYASEIERKLVLKANSLIARPTTALDIGCEGGRWSKLLSDVGWSMICTDIHQRSLDICQKRIPTAICIHVSPADTHLPAESESIELLLCVQVPPVIHSQWFTEEAFRVLQKGGLVVGVVWNRSSWRGLLYHGTPALRIRGSGQWYWFPFSYSAWRKRFCDKGFTMMHEEGYGWIPFRRSSDSRFVPISAQIEHHLGLRKLVGVSPLVTFIAQKD